MPQATVLTTCRRAASSIGIGAGKYWNPGLWEGGSGGLERLNRPCGIEISQGQYSHSPYVGFITLLPRNSI